MRYINVIHAPFLHKIGNMLQSIIGIIDNLICLLSLGNLSSQLVMKFIELRVEYKF